MGLGIFSKCKFTSADIASVFDNHRNKGNPNPKRFSFINFKEVGRYLVIKINYPDCENYEGNKILVYKDVSFADLRRKNYIDPHFCQHKKCKSPIARFEPTPEGWSNAILLATMLSREEEK